MKNTNLPIRSGSRRLLCSGLAICLGVFSTLAVPVSQLCGDTITNIDVDNQSFGPAPDPNSGFQTQSTLTGVQTVGDTSFFTHRMAARNWLVANGSVAQVHKGNVIYDLEFTVNDPLNLGYEISLENVLKGISLVDVGTNPTAGFCYSTGLNLASYYGSTFLAGISGSTLGTGFQTAGYHALYEEYTGTQFVGNFQGTNTFNFHFTSLVTPTTNVVFDNFAFGRGEVIYGLGSIPTGFEQYDMADLGHFLTVNVKMNAVPEPGSVGLLGLVMAGLAFVRPRRNG